MKVLALDIPNEEIRHSLMASSGVCGLFFDILTIFSQRNITFILGTCLTLMAGIYYFLQIQKLIREKTKERKLYAKRNNHNKKDTSNETMY